MENNFRLSYLKLIQDTRLFIQNKSGQNALLKKNVQDSIKVVKHEREVQIKDQGISSLPVKSQVNPLPTKESKKSTWDLQTMPQAIENESLRDKLTKFTPTCDLNIPTFLLLPEEESTHRLFLENVARAITKSFSPACVTLFHDHFFKDQLNKVFLIPLKVLEKKNFFLETMLRNQKMLSFQPHSIVKTDTFTLLLLDDLNEYAHDLNSKRALWNTIQLLFQSK